MAIPSFDEANLEHICAVLADTNALGLTGLEIGSLLAQLHIKDPEPGLAKQRRLFAALRSQQREDRSGNVVGRFIHKAMSPARYTSRKEQFEKRRIELNQVLVFCGYFLGEDGRLLYKRAARTLVESDRRADKLRTELRRRGVHPKVLNLCSADLLRSKSFHLVLEARNGLAAEIRLRSGLSEDGSKLVDMAFGRGNSGIPILALSALENESERNEQAGIMHIMKGMLSAYRNACPLDLKVCAAMSDREMLDMLTVASLLHYRLDDAIRTPLEAIA